MQSNDIALAKLIWQQRAAEACQMMATLIASCSRVGTDDALQAIERLQSEFVASVLQHPLTLKFMQSSPALQRCVRLLVDACDALGAGIDDDMANFMAAAACSPNPTWLHRIFPLDSEVALPALNDRNVCVAKVATSFNQVGLSVWTAGFCLIEACLGGVLQLSGKVVCEVGAGVGLTAVALSKAAASSPHVLPARLIVTDYCAPVLENMDNTLSTNGIDFVSNWHVHPPKAPPPRSFIVSDLLDVRDARACAEFAALHQVHAAHHGTSSRFAVFRALFCRSSRRRARSHRLFQPDVFVGADITYDPVLVSAKPGISSPTTHSETIPALRQIKDFCSAMVVMMKAVGRSIDVLVTATVRTQVRPAPRTTLPPPACSRASKSVFQGLLECAAEMGFDVLQLDISGRPRLFDVDDSLVKQLKLCVRPEVLSF
jgi:hypothetical protein